MLLCILSRSDYFNSFKSGIFYYYILESKLCLLAEYLTFILLFSIFSTDDPSFYFSINIDSYYY